MVYPQEHSKRKKLESLPQEAARSYELNRKSICVAPVLLVHRAEHKVANNKEIKVRDETSGKKTLLKNLKKRNRNNGPRFSEINVVEEKGAANSRKISVILSRLISVLWYRIAVS